MPKTPPEADPALASDHHLRTGPTDADVVCPEETLAAENPPVGGGGEGVGRGAEVGVAEGADVGAGYLVGAWGGGGGGR